MLSTDTESKAVPKPDTSIELDKSVLPAFLLKRPFEKISYLKTLFGCPLFNMTVSPECVKKITHETINKMGSIYWHCIAGQTVFPVQIAYNFKIPLIIWGAHQGIDQVGMFSHLDEVEMTRKYRKEHDLMGIEAQDLAKGSNIINNDDVEPYLYPHDKELEMVGVRGIYLSNYIRWDSKAQHENMINHYNYETAKQQRTFDNYNHVDCFHYTGLHDYIKFLKYGYGKVTDHACREIRLKRMTREEGISLVKDYINVKPWDNQLFLDWLGKDINFLYRNVNKYRDHKIWKREDGDWKLKDSVINHVKDKGIDAHRLDSESDHLFRIVNEKEKNIKDNKYILVGRGWVDVS